MLQLNRREQITVLLRERKNMTVKELCASLFCSPATVRRDLRELEKQGVIKRSFGGAVINESFFDQQPLSVRGIKNVAEKQRLCAKAAGLLCEGATVFVDASSTTYFLARYARDIPNLTVITNTPHLNILLSQMNVRNYCTGGEMLNSSIALVGSEAERFVRGIRADAFFFSARGFFEGRIYDSSKAERDIKTAMLENSERSYFLCDSSKLGKPFPYAITEESRITKIIT